MPLLLALLGCPRSEAPPPPPNVILVVLDTVRADHLSACGYGRPTSPYLEKLAKVGAFRCDVVSPASWTVPSHATFFTGLAPPEHGVLNNATYKEKHTAPVFSLPDETETLAERFEARGYATALVAGNPLVGRVGNLAQGFEQVHAGRRRATLTGPWLVPALRDVLAKRDASKPLFLVVNLFDAHDPWPTIPPGVGWVPERPLLEFPPEDEGSDYVKFHRGTLTPEAKESYARYVTDQYDYGLWRTDQQLERVVGHLQEAGLLSGPYRLVVTSDHGELLGEHDRLRHGGNVYEGNVRVPFLWIESPIPEPPLDLAGPMSGDEVFSILDTGHRPAAASVVVYTEPIAGHPDAGVWGMARYEGDKKIVTGVDGTRTYDLSTDPTESAPILTPPTEQDRERFERWHANAARMPGAGDVDDSDILQQLGYQQ